MYVYIYVCVFIYVIYRRGTLYIYIYICMYMYYIYIYMCVSVCIYLYNVQQGYCGKRWARSMYIQTHARMHMYMCAYKDTHTHTSEQHIVPSSLLMRFVHIFNICMYKGLYIYLYMCVGLYIHLYMYIFRFKYSCVCVHIICTQRNTCTHTEVDSTPYLPSC